ncbi:hypothetical protein IKE_05717 [Bacillus cereus VD196]|uniref:Two-component system response regulator vanR n=1 Tax=Bacillus cereus VD196 TaxID=1053243 RepID=A0A9W5V628_BACCE|nr:hypothetical protein IKG_05825 [Bacillus cereus VD200]EOO62290.1 hypothetical protein IKE_05717 [Bacillus cereus VD196]
MTRQIRAKYHMPIIFLSAKTSDFGKVTGLVLGADDYITKPFTSIELTPKEFDILYLLASHPKKVFGIENIFQQVWGDDYYNGASTVTVHIRTLRKKLGEDKRKNQLIKTIWE